MNVKYNGKIIEGPMKYFFILTMFMLVTAIFGLIIIVLTSPIWILVLLGILIGRIV